MTSNDFDFGWQNVYGTLLDSQYSAGVNISIAGQVLGDHLSLHDWRFAETQDELYEDQCDFDDKFFGVLAYLASPPVSNLLVHYDCNLSRTSEFCSLLREYLDKVRDYEFCEDQTFKELDALKAKLRPLAAWLVLVGRQIADQKHTTKGETPPSPPKEKNKGGRPPGTTDERAEQVQRWWEQFLGDPTPEGYQTPKHFRKRSADDFLAWGEFRELQDFPKNKEEVERCKKRYRDLQREKAAKTKTRKRR
jgi:hypothetical protein